MRSYVEMTRAVAGARSVTSHTMGRIQVGASVVLYAVPRGAPASLEMVAFPGDAVPFPLWQSLPGAHGDHPHSGGLLAALLGRLERAGVASATALVVIEPASLQVPSRPGACYVGTPVSKQHKRPFTPPFSGPPRRLLAAAPAHDSDRRAVGL